MIEYRTTAEAVLASQLRGGFFAGWPNPPSPETHLRLLQGSSHVVIAVDDTSGDLVGFVTAISDSVLAAYIPLLEVLTEHQSRGIGSELFRRMLAQLSGYYVIDLLCDERLQPWYERFGMWKSSGMMARNYGNQSGRGV